MTAATVSPLEIESPQKAMGANVRSRLVVIPDLSQFASSSSDGDFRWSAGLLQEFFAWTTLAQTHQARGHHLVVAAPTLQERLVHGSHFQAAFTEYTSLLYGIEMYVIFNQERDSGLGWHRVFSSSPVKTRSMVYVYTKEFFNLYKGDRAGSRFHRDPWQDILQRHVGSDAFDDWTLQWDLPLADHLAVGEITPSPENDAAPEEIYLLAPHADRFRTAPRAFIIPRQG